MMRRNKTKPAATLGAAKPKSRKKRIIALVICLAAVCAISYGVIRIRKQNTLVYVEPVENLTYDSIFEENMVSGSLAEGAAQNIILGPTDHVGEVFVQEGQAVAAGDPLFSYDTSELEIDVESKKLEAESDRSTLAIAKQQLAEYQKIVPQELKPILPEETGNTEEPDDTAEPGEPAEPEALDDQAEPDAAADPDDQGDSESIDDMESESGVKAQAYTPSDAGVRFAASTGFREDDDVITYTAEEKAKLIADKQAEIAKLENQIALDDNAVAQAESKLKDTTVKAVIDGVVQKIGDPANPPQDGSAFCTVTANAGASITSAVSEYDLETLSVGDRVSVRNWFNDAETEATITEISRYPLDDAAAQEYAADGVNRNVSWYPYTAVLDDAAGFTGTEVSIGVTLKYDRNTVILEMPFVRSDAKGAYCMVDDGGRLVKRRVKTGRKYEGLYVTIEEGLKKSDLIALPYGKTVREGARTTQTPPMSLF